MVIVIIGVLAGLLLFAVGGGTKKAKNAAVLSEIEQIQSAIETYRTERGSYPPTLGIFVGDGALGSGPPTNPKWPVAQQNRVLRHVAKAFPRYIPTSGFASLRNDVSTATAQVSWPADVGPSKLNSGLDMEHLDPAETLVFFLGGLPNPNAETKLAPLRLDPASPFIDTTASTADPYPGQRGKVFFPFDARRLVDYDKDGWWEYLPPGGTQEGNTPPYVYFDSNIYKSGPAYPYPSAAGAVPRLIGPVSNEFQWGNCIPYSADPAPTGTQPLKFVNSQKFQIIAPGMDNKYHKQLLAGDVLGGTPWWFTPEFFPSTASAQVDDQDNLTNFAGGTLADSAPTP